MDYYWHSQTYGEGAQSPMLGELIVIQSVRLTSLVQKEKALLEVALQKEKALMEAAKKEACDALVGRRISKMFEGHGNSQGTITSADPVSTCGVKYDDGDDETMSLEEAETPLVKLTHCRGTSKAKKDPDPYLKRRVAEPGAMWHLTGVEGDAVYLGVIRSVRSRKGSKGEKRAGYLVHFHDDEKWELTAEEPKSYIIDDAEVQQLVESEVPTQNASATEISELEAEQEKKEASSTTHAASEEVGTFDLLDDPEQMDWDDEMELCVTSG